MQLCWWYQVFDSESANSGIPGIRSLVQRFDMLGAAGRFSAGGSNRQGRSGKDDGLTAPVSDRPSRSRSLAARWPATTVNDILHPPKPRWMTTKLDKTRECSHREDFDRQHQVSRRSDCSNLISIWHFVKDVHDETNVYSVLCI